VTVPTLNVNGSSDYSPHYINISINQPPTLGITMNVRDTIHNLQVVIADLSRLSAETEVSIRTDNYTPLSNIMEVEDKNGTTVLTITEIEPDPVYDDDYFDGFVPCSMD